MHKSLTRFMWLSIAAAVITIGLKTLAYFLTGSVGLLSDALESIVNLVAAVIALVTLRIAEKPPDKDHVFGHTKAEYFSSISEGLLIIIAAISIAVTAGNRFFHPQPLENTTIGLAVTVVASAINAVVAMILLKVGKKHRSITLEADGHHLMTDVWTSVGVIGGVFLVTATHIVVLDPIIAILVALNILYTGIKVMKQSALGLLDTSIPEAEIARITTILESYARHGVQYHGLLTRESATRKFVSVHILVPGQWSVQKGHDLLEDIESDIRKAFVKVTVFTHMEPVEDPKSQEDISIDRKSR